MKALVYLGKESMDYREMPDPHAGAGEVIVKVAACGICGSDMHGFHGHDPRRVPPLIMGHEAAGVAESGVLAGKRVAINPLVTCGQCSECLDGAPQLCESQSVLGLPPRGGAFADRVAVPERNLVEIPEGTDFRTAALTEPFAVAYHAVRLGARNLRRPLSAARVAVIGGCTIGIATALILTAQGAGEVILGEPNPQRRQAARGAGHFDVYDPGTAREPGPASMDLVFDAVGAKATREAAFRMTRRGGAIVHLGLLPGSEGVDVRRLTLGEIAFLGSYCYSMPDFREALGLLAARRLGPLNWVEERPMSDGFQAFIDLDRNQAEAVKIILTN